jgi:hypothetical protein
MDGALSWTRRWGLATWTYGLLPAPGAEADGLREPEARRGLARTVEWLLGLLGDFATPAHVEVSTRSGGEDAFTGVFEQTPPEALFAFLTARPEVSFVQLYLTLHCVDADPAPLVIPNGAALRLYISLDEGDRLAAGKAEPIELVLSLNVDVYSPQTTAVEPDKALLAALNGPRLTAFLLRLEDDLGARFLGLDAEGTSRSPSATASTIGRHRRARRRSPSTGGQTPSASSKPMPQSRSRSLLE